MSLGTRKWDTADEIQIYLEKIGKVHESTRNMPRWEILERYLAGLEKRVNWGNLDREKIINAAKMHLAFARLDFARNGAA